MTLDGLRSLTPGQWEALCRHLLPGGRKDGYRWPVGSALGEPGRSFDVNLHTGVFGDWATDDRRQRGPINLWMTARGVDFKTALQELSTWLGRPCDPPPNAYLRSADIPPLRPTGSTDSEKKIFLPPNLSKPTEKDLQILSESRSIGVEALRIAVKRGFLWCFDDEFNGRCWLFTDQRRRCGLRRRLDNKPFRLRSGSEVKCAACPGSDMRGPIGYQEAASYPCIGIAEGGPNSLAVLAHAWASGVEERVAPVCMPSTTANFSESSLAYLQGKRARIFIDDDVPGHVAADRWAKQLRSAGVVVDGFSFAGLVVTDGEAVKDLNDLLVIDCDCWEQFRNQFEAVMNFAL
jgi:hypothetical protein